MKMNYIFGAVFNMQYTNCFDKKMSFNISFWSRRVVRIVLERSLKSEWHCKWIPIDIQYAPKFGKDYLAVAICPEKKLVAFVKL